MFMFCRRRCCTCLGPARPLLSSRASPVQPCTGTQTRGSEAERGVPAISLQRTSSQRSHLDTRTFAASGRETYLPIPPSDRSEPGRRGRTYVPKGRSCHLRTPSAHGFPIFDFVTYGHVRTPAYAYAEWSRSEEIVHLSSTPRTAYAKIRVSHI